MSPKKTYSNKRRRMKRSPKRLGTDIGSGRDRITCSALIIDPLRSRVLNLLNRIIHPVRHSQRGIRRGHGRTGHLKGIN